MYCGNCGAQNPDGAAHCGNCGAPLNTGAQGGAVAASAKKNRNIGIAITVGLVVVVVAAVLIIIFAVGGGSPKSVAEDMLEALFDGDLDKIVKMVPDELIKGIAKEEDMTTREAREELSDMLEDELDGVSDYISMMDVSVKATGEDDYDSDELDDVKDDYADYDVKVKSAKTVEVKVSMEFLGQKQTEELDVPVVKIGGDWYVDFINLDKVF